MKKHNRIISRTVLSLLIAASLIGIADAKTETVTLATGSNLSISLDNSLELHNEPATPKRPAVLIVKDKKNPIEAHLIFSLPEQVPPEEIRRKQIIAAAQPALINSKEGTIELKKIPNSSFSILYFELTDKREDPGEGRFMLQGMGASGKHTCHIIMLTNQKSSKTKTAIIKAIGSMKIIQQERE